MTDALSDLAAFQEAGVTKMDVFEAIDRLCPTTSEKLSGFEADTEVMGQTISCHVGGDGGAPSSFCPGLASMILVRYSRASGLRFSKYFSARFFSHSSWKCSAKSEHCIGLNCKKWNRAARTLLDGWPRTSGNRVNSDTTVDLVATID